MNAQTQFTPGPWQALNGGPYVTTRKDPEGEYVIAVTSNTASNVVFAAKVASLEDKANAQLIAASPDLYEACNALLTYMQARCIPYADDPWGKSAVERAQAAIAKVSR